MFHKFFTISDPSVIELRNKRKVENVAQNKFKLPKPVVLNRVGMPPVIPFH